MLPIPLNPPFCKGGLVFFNDPNDFKDIKVPKSSFAPSALLLLRLGNKVNLLHSSAAASSVKGDFFFFNDPNDFKDIKAPKSPFEPSALLLLRLGNKVNLLHSLAAAVL